MIGETPNPDDEETFRNYFNPVSTPADGIHSSGAKINEIEPFDVN